MAHTITLIPGDGIGPEVTDGGRPHLHAPPACRSTGIGRTPASSRSSGSASRCRPQLLDSVKRNKVALKGPVTTPIGEGFTSVNVGLRKALDLYSNLRPVKNLPGVESRFQNVDLIIVRENTEDLYAGLEHEIVPGIVESLKIITEKASTRIARFAFEYARTFGRKRVTAIHKANIMKLSDGLFLESCRNVVARVHRHHLRRAHRRRGVHAPRHAPGEARRAAAAESLRRHRVRSVRRAGRRARAWCPERTSGPTAPSSRRCTAAPPTSRIRTWPIPTALLLSGC